MLMHQMSDQQSQGVTQWVGELYPQLLEAGVNTLGNWAHYQDFQGVGADMPFTVRLNLASYYKHHSGHDSDDYEETGAVPVFNADFKEVVAAGAKKLIEEGNFLEERLVQLGESSRRSLMLISGTLWVTSPTMNFPSTR